MTENNGGRAARGRRWWRALATGVLVLVIVALFLTLGQRTPGDQLTEAEIQAELARAGAIQSAPTGLEDRPHPPIDIPPAE